MHIIYFLLLQFLTSDITIVRILGLKCLLNVSFRKLLMCEPFSELYHFFHLRLYVGKEIYNTAVYYIVIRCFSSRMKIFERSSDV